MERTFDKRAVGVLAFAVASFFALAFAPQAHAATQATDLAAADLAVQATADNTTMEQASVLKSGEAQIGCFEHADGTPPSTIHDYWYKFKTSNRDSVYELKVESIDNNMMWVTCYDAQMNEFDWGSATGVFSVSALDYLTDLPKDQVVYFKFAVTKTYLDYNKRFRVRVTEYPPIEWVTKLKASKKTSKSLTMTWKKQPNATRYQVKYRMKGGKWKTKYVAKNAVALKSLKKNTVYQVKVRAYCNKCYNVDTRKVSKWGDWSNVAKVKTAK